MKDNQVFVIWNWTWLADEDVGFSKSEENSESESVVDSNGDEPDDEVDDDIPAITHSVVFKCIGCHKESRYQEVLALAQRKRARDGANIPLKLQPEPSNPMDSKAIAFMCKADTDWERIGYVVQEALDDVHEAINTNKILALSFQCLF